MVPSSSSYQKQNHLPSLPIKKLNQRNPNLIPTNSSWRRLGVTGHQPLDGAFMEPWRVCKIENLRQVPVAHMANTDVVPDYPVSLRVSGMHLLPMGQWCGDGGSSQPKAMLVVGHCNLPIWELLVLMRLWHWRQHSLGMDDWFKYENGRVGWDIGDMWAWKRCIIINIKFLWGDAF